MRHTFAIVTITAMFVVNGAIGLFVFNEAESTEPMVEDPVALQLEEPVWQIVRWDAHTAVGGWADLLTHSVYTETVLFPVQQSGFLLAIDEVPLAIEVRVDWDEPLAGDAAYQLHPHFIVEPGEGALQGNEYYGFRSDDFSESGGCIRIPAREMAAGVWPMMVHAVGMAIETDFTITVGILGAEGRVLDEMHGHRLFGNAMEDRGVEPCTVLVGPAA